jgi:hypothetical protein
LTLVCGFQSRSARHDHNLRFLSMRFCGKVTVVFANSNNMKPRAFFDEFSKEYEAENRYKYRWYRSLGKDSVVYEQQSSY